MRHPFITRALPGALSLLCLFSCAKDNEEPAAAGGGGTTPPPPPPASTSFVPVELIHDSITDIDGNQYYTVLIGTQEWMAQNLRTTRYRDGSAIPYVPDNAEWTALDTGAWCNYVNNAIYDSPWGKLYNWYAAAAPNICPEGWHVPTLWEYDTLRTYLGGSTVAGGKMKSTSDHLNFGWMGGNAGATNESGFTALPNGRRSFDGAYDVTPGHHAYFWTSTPQSTGGGYRYRLWTGDSTFSQGTDNKRYGFCIRCLKD